MARDRSVALSEEELEQLKKVRIEIFDTDEVPYGAVISKLSKECLSN